MKKPNKNLIAAMGIPVFLFLIVFGFGACRSHGHGFLTAERIHTVIDWKVNDFMDKIDATPEQRQQIETLKMQLMQEAITLHAQLHRDQDFFLDQWKSSVPDRDRIHAEIDHHADLKRAFAHKVTNAIIDLHDILTVEQRAELMERIEELRRHHRSLNSD